MKVDFSGTYTNAENCREGDIGTIVGEGSSETKTSFKGDEYTQYNIDVEVNGKKLVHSPRMSEGKALVAQWGDETKNWIGKQFKCRIVNYKSMGQTKTCVEIEPITKKVK